jgi:hypothetical protein
MTGTHVLGEQPDDNEAGIGGPWHRREWLGDNEGLEVKLPCLPGSVRSCIDSLFREWASTDREGLMRVAAIIACCSGEFIPSISGCEFLEREEFLSGSGLGRGRCASCAGCGVSLLNCGIGMSLDAEPAEQMCARVGGHRTEDASCIHRT